VQVPVPIRRHGYRVAHRMLRAWWFVVRPRVQGVKCVLTDGDRVLLVRHTYGHHEWDFPGGGVRRGEEPLAAARREMEEELGVRLDGLRAIGEISARPYRSRDRIHCFHAELGAAGLTIDEAELATAEWFERRQLPTDTSRYVSPILALMAQG
jgi:8-oxo-dGTP pyrophosphatase MutT (NUDIX family)